MTRIFRLFLLSMAVVGLFGQSTAMAMSPVQSDATAMSAMASMDCDDMASRPMDGSIPCKKMTLQCIAAMGCHTAAIAEPIAIALASRQVDRLAPSWPSAAALNGLSYGPEPDPPSFLI